MRQSVKVVVATVALPSPSLHKLVPLLDHLLIMPSILLAEPVAIAIIQEARKPSGANSTVTQCPLYASYGCGLAARTTAAALP
jgi:hypothetical protein